MNNLIDLIFTTFLVSLLPVVSGMILIHFVIPNMSDTFKDFFKFLFFASLITTIIVILLSINFVINLAIGFLIGIGIEIIRSESLKKDH